MVQTRWDGMRLCTNQRGRKKVGRTQVPDCRERFTQSLSHHSPTPLTHSSPLSAGWRVGTCWLLLAPVVSVLWAGDLAGAPCADTFLSGSRWVRWGT